MTDGVLVYVKDCSNPAHIGNVYAASVSGVNITWNFSSAVLPGTWVFATYGTEYHNTIIVSGDTVTNL